MTRLGRWVLVALVLCIAVGVRGPAASAAPPTVEGDQVWVTAVYHDLLDRAPTAAERAAIDRVPPGGASGRTHLVGSMTKSPEWLQRAVDLRYREILGRDGDSVGLAYWTRVVGAGRTTLAAMTAVLYASPERVIATAEPRDRNWVADLYRDILGREAVADPGGSNHWVGMAETKGRYVVALAISRSAEAIGRRVDAVYRTLLDRDADSAGRTYWSRVLARSGEIPVVSFLVASDEYARRSTLRFGGTAVPEAPPAVVVKPSVGAVQVSWVAPPQDPRVPILGYVASTLDGRTCTTDGATSCSIVGLADGEQVAVVVTATNAVGEGDPSSSVVAVPEAATLDVQATVSYAEVRLRWTLPPDPGTLGRVHLVAFRAGEEVWQRDVDFLATWLPGGTWGFDVEGLDTDVRYDFLVQLVGSAARVSGLSGPMRPLAVPADALRTPELLGADPGDSTATVWWTFTPGPIVARLVRMQVLCDGEVIDSIEVPLRSTYDPSLPSEMGWTFTGLTNGSPVAFRVALVFGNVQGPWSASSAVVTPSG